MSTPAPPRFTDEQRLQWVAEQVKAWRTYVEPPHLPAPTSVQADDDKIFSAIPPFNLHTLLLWVTPLLLLIATALVLRRNARTRAAATALQDAAPAQPCMRA